MGLGAPNLARDTIWTFGYLVSSYKVTLGCDVDLAWLWIGLGRFWVASNLDFFGSKAMLGHLISHLALDAILARRYDLTMWR